MAFFSIIIPSYNRAGIVVNAVEAVLKQSFSDFEVIVVDDGSSDNTKDQLAPFLNDLRVKYIYQQNKGVCAARNTGTMQATGQYLLFLDSDDTVENNWLSDFYHVLKTGEPDIAFCNMKVIQQDGTAKLVNADKPYKDSPVKGMFIAGLFAVKKELFIRAGMYDVQMKFGENTELGYRLKEHELRMVFVSNYNIIYSPSAEGGSKNLRNKLTSNLYLLHKHQEHFKKNLRSKKLFMQVAAVAAARLGEYKQANQIFYDALKADKKDFKLWAQYLLTLFPFLAKLKWRAK